MVKIDNRSLDYGQVLQVFIIGVMGEVNDVLGSNPFQDGICYSCLA
jgi:hypothetical protein